MKRFGKIAVFILALFFASSAVFAQSDDRLSYKSGYVTMMKLGKDLHDAIKQAYREKISAQPISIETDGTPFVRLLYFEEQPKPISGVWISAGFIDLVNNVAHATAINLKERGYFNRYIEVLAHETGEKELRPLPNDNNPKYWTDDMLNEQLSNFNSIVGMVVGIKLAHHYLGHYEKYKDKLNGPNGRPISINNFLTEREWEEAFRLGVRNSLDAGYMTEGAIPFFEAFEKMKVRPPWASYFLPDNIKFSRMKKEMEKIQRKFLEGEE